MQNQNGMGTRAYMAPELFQRQKNGIPITAKVDVWAAGVLLYLLVLNKTHFNRRNRILDS